MTPQSTKRRQFLRLGFSAAGALLIPGLAAACRQEETPGERTESQDETAKSNPRAAGGEAPKLDKAQARYQAEPNGAEQCDGCQHFLAQSGSCALVEGDISRTGWCSLWVARAG